LGDQSTSKTLNSNLQFLWFMKWIT